MTLVTPEGVRDRVRFTDGGEHRPVHTLRSLPRGWRAVLNEADLRRAVHYTYPAVVEETYAHGCHALRPTPGRPPRGGRRASTRRCSAPCPNRSSGLPGGCAACLRTRLWAGERLTHSFLDGVPGGMPCAEACTFLVAEVREEVARKKAGAASASDD